MSYHTSIKLLGCNVLVFCSYGRLFSTCSEYPDQVHRHIIRQGLFLPADDSFRAYFGTKMHTDLRISYLRVYVDILRVNAEELEIEAQCPTVMKFPRSTYPRMSRRTLLPSCSRIRNAPILSYVLRTRLALTVSRATSSSKVMGKRQWGRSPSTCVGARIMG